MLLVENLYESKIIKEEKDGIKSWMIEGVFMQSDVVNKNRRLYPKAVMESEVGNYVKNSVEGGQAVGELSHPDNLTINLQNVCHKIEKMWQEGSNFYGKARVLNTPSGKILQGLLEGGVRLGVSSRGTGSIAPNSSGISEVQNDFRLICIDAVLHPSAPEAFVRGLMEGQSQIWDQSDKDIQLLESITVDVKKANAKRLQEAKFAAFSKAMKYLKG